MSKVITLQYPYVHNGERYESVTLKRARAKDMRVIAQFLPAFASMQEGEELDPGAIDGLIAITASLSDLPDAAIEMMDFTDLSSIAKVLGDFFPQATPVETSASGVA